MKIIKIKTNTYTHHQKKWKTIFILFISLFTASNALADISLTFDNTGNFIPPDMILQARALNDFDNGFKKLAIRNFKKSVEFGNERSKYFLALMFFKNKEWARGYAWLKLINDSADKRENLLMKIESLITADEKTDSHRILQNLKSKYNTNNSLRRRHKWERSIQGTGTHIQGLKALTLSRATLDFGYGIAITPEVIKKVVYENYVLEYKPKGRVIMGAIETVDEE